MNIEISTEQLTLLGYVKTEDMCYEKEIATTENLIRTSFVISIYTTSARIQNPSMIIPMLFLITVADNLIQFYPKDIEELKAIENIFNPVRKS